VKDRANNPYDQENVSVLGRDLRSSAIVGSPPASQALSPECPIIDGFPLVGRPNCWSGSLALAWEVSVARPQMVFEVKRAASSAFCFCFLVLCH
jgi:hypothetical protein